MFNKKTPALLVQLITEASICAGWKAGC